MLALPKRLLPLGVSFLTTQATRRLKARGRAIQAQERALRTLLTGFAATDFGHEHGLSAGMTPAAFRTAVPPRTYEQVRPYIDRMKQGEESVLWPGFCSFYAVSSGTTAGACKCLPVTEAMLRHFRRAGLDALLYYTARVGHTAVFRGRHLLLGGTTTLSSLDAAKEPPAYTGDISAIATLNLPDWVEKQLHEPGAAIANLADWPTKLKAIAERTAARDISLLAGMPNWLLPLAEAVHAEAGSRNGTTPANLKAIWPNLECVVHGGVPLAPFAAKLRAAVGPDVSFHEVYPASEGFIATQDTDAAAGLRLMTDVGLYYEFLPQREFDEAQLASLGDKVVPLEGVQAGVDYVLLLTTPAGLCRYVVGDVVRFTSTEPPRLIYVGRTHLQLNAFGEYVVERELTDTLTSVCLRHGWAITNFHVAPWFEPATDGRASGAHEWWVELRPRMIETPTGPALANEIDRELQDMNSDYASRRRSGAIGAPVVRLVMPGVFESWMRAHGAWGGHHKMPRCRSDRKVADELGQLAPFSRD
ncbi:GH3 auxin-responsive promoter family protein [Opitutaceae bacterium]